MATIRLVPSTIYNGSSSYLTITSASNAYTNTDSTTYASVQNTRSSTSSYYVYLQGFNFNDVPSNAIVSDISIKIKAYHSGGNTSTIYAYNGTSTQISAAGSTTALGTSATVKTFTNTTIGWDTLKSYGSDFGIRINCRRSDRNTTSYIYIYGAEIEVTYTVPSADVTGVTVSPTTAAIEVGESVTLTETVLPSNAANKNVSWSTSNSSVATVSEGVVTGQSAGSATITVTTQQGGYTATCLVTVQQAVTYDYILATSMQVGKKYLIANGNSGTVYLLTNESGGSRQLNTIQATVSGNKITINSNTKSKAEFECIRYTAGNDVTITVKSDDKYLYTDNSSGLRMNAPSTLDRFWHYRNNKFWQFKNTSNDGYTDTSSEYKYYIELNSSNNYTDQHVTSPSIEDTDIPAIYIYVEDDGSLTQDSAYFKINNTWVQVSEIYKKINGSWVKQTSFDDMFDSNSHYKITGN